MSENRGGAERDYIPDALGNTIALMDSAGTKTDTFSYFPFGNVASRTGTTATPFKWNGGSGYYQDSASRTYVRARTMYTSLARWSKQDPIGFKGRDYNLYRYVLNMVMTAVDPSGLSTPHGCDCAKSWGPNWENCDADTFKWCSTKVCKGPNCVKSCCKPKGQPAGASICVPKSGDCSAAKGYVPGKPTPSPGATPAPPHGVPQNPWFSPDKPGNPFGYGNCCGPMRGVSKIDAKNPNPGIDCLDKACCRHDACIEAGGGFFGHSRTRSACDAVLCREAISMGNCCGWNLSCQVAAIKIRTWFCIGGNHIFDPLDPGWFG